MKKSQKLTMQADEERAREDEALLRDLEAEKSAAETRKLILTEDCAVDIAYFQEVAEGLGRKSRERFDALIREEESKIERCAKMIAALRGDEADPKALNAGIVELKKRAKEVTE